MIPTHCVPNVFVPVRTKSSFLLRGVGMSKFRKTLLISTVFFNVTVFGNVVPEEVVQSLRKGYSEEEQVLLDSDLEYIRSLVFRRAKQPKDRKPIYLATAGAPGARKSTILESYLKGKPELGDVVYVDPDQRALRFMGNTYYGRSLSNFQISQASDYQTAQKSAYDYWRAGSNYIANTLLNEAVAGGFDIAHGTTLTGPYSGALLKKLRESGYQIVLVLCGAEDKLRMETVQHRNEVQGFYQTDPKDVEMKALLFPKRLKDYFENADTLWFHWSETLTSSMKPAAYISIENKKFDIFSEDLYRKFVAKIDEDAKKQDMMLTWNGCLEDRDLVTKK